MDAVQEVSWAQTGVIGFLVLGVLWTGFQKKWVFGWVHREQVEKLEAEVLRERQRGDEWEAVALTHAGLIRNTVETAQEVVRKVAMQDES